MNNLRVATISAYDPIELTAPARAYLSTYLEGHDLAFLINVKLKSGELVAHWQLLDSGVYGYVVSAP
jgi:hypothetical protein